VQSAESWPICHRSRSQSFRRSSCSGPTPSTTTLACLSPETSTENGHHLIKSMIFLVSAINPVEMDGPRGHTTP
jgi:hypothetical protein